MESLKANTVFGAIGGAFTFGANTIFDALFFMKGTCQ